MVIQCVSLVQADKRMIGRSGFEPSMWRRRTWFRSVAASFHALVAKWMLWLSCT